jgi:hypothetical protein
MILNPKLDKEWPILIKIFPYLIKLMNFILNSYSLFPYSQKVLHLTDDRLQLLKFS